MFLFRPHDIRSQVGKSVDSEKGPTKRDVLEGGRGLSKLVISRVIIRITPFRALITLLVTCLLSPLPLQVL